MSKVFIGVAWPYANGPLHLGHLAGSLLPPDIFARYHRMKGNEVLMVSGSDMHGTPITVTAEKEGITPEEVATRFHEMNSEAIHQTNISFDLFTSTHTPNHEETVQWVFKTLVEKDYIYKKTSNEAFCASCQRFLPDRYVEGTCPHCDYEEARGDQCDNCGKTLEPEELKDSKCKLCSSSPEMKPTEHFYLKLSAFEPMLEDYVIVNEDHWRANVKNFTKNWLDSGLKDRAITRDLTWGVPIPEEGFEKKRIYVWFEAVCGYFSASKQWAKESGNPDKWKEFWHDPECKHFYYLGKDNIPFHTIIWPSILHGVGDMNLPYDVPANEYLMLNSEQFSKSRNNAIWLHKYLERYDVDVLRYYLSVNMPENRDSDFTWADFVRRNNTELMSALSNLIHRVLTFTKKHFDGVPQKAGRLTEEDKKMLEFAKEAIRKEGEAIEINKFKDGIGELMALAHEANRYFTASEPWKVIKEDKELCGAGLNTSIQVLKCMAVGMAPYMPGSAQKLWDMLGQEGEIAKASWDAYLEEIPEGVSLPEPKPLFTKMDLDEVLKIEQAASEEESEEEPEKEKMPIVTFDEFMKLDLRVGKVLSVDPHPKADKLYVLKVDLGNEQRQIIAGLRPYYEPEEMIGKTITIVANLAPAKLRGVESQGMLLAAEDDKGVVSLLVSDREITNGSKVH